ncbi:MAG: hypothetical protein ACLR8Y_09440 [Alistipes indistinctus]
MKQAGYGGAFLHSRIGLLTPFYLGEEWFRMMQIGTQALQALDMDVWYYDEDKMAQRLCRRHRSAAEPRFPGPLA